MPTSKKKKLFAPDELQYACSVLTDAFSIIADSRGTYQPVSLPQRITLRNHKSVGAIEYADTWEMEIDQRETAIISLTEQFKSNDLVKRLNIAQYSEHVCSMNAQYTVSIIQAYVGNRYFHKQ